MPASPDEKPSSLSFLPKVKKWFKPIYHQLVEINDTPLRTGVGLGLGVFCGIFPGMGPLASLAAASLLRVNKAAALSGSLLTNSWLSVVSFAIAVKIGAAASGAQWTKVSADCQLLIKNFHWRDLFNVSVLGILKPLLIGYALLGLLLGAAVSIAAIIFLTLRIKKLK